MVRLKQLEHALADGRLDVGYELARAADMRADRRGAELVDRLAGALTGRGRAHAEAGRIPEAAVDCEKAAVLAGNDTQVAELRAAVAGATAARADADRLRGQQIAAARRQIDAGQLSVGQGLLGAIEGDHRAEALSQDLAARRATLRSAVTKATAAFEADDWQTAIDHLAGLCRQFPADGELGAIAGKVTRHVVGLITGAIEAGRLDLASLYLARLERMERASLELEPLRRTMQDCGAAYEMTRGADAGEALETVRRLALLWPGAAWLKSVCERLGEAAEALEAVRSGPLGLMARSSQPLDQQETMPMTNPAKPIRRLPHPPAVGRGEGARFILHVDGVGSFQVIDQAVVVVGPVGSAAAADVAVLAGSEAPPVTITRTDGDYFLQSRQPVSINDKATTGKLLASGDRIAMGPRCRLAFRRPSAASGTAILDLTAARLARGDVRQVILLDREIIIGPGSAAHVRCDALAQAAVLQQSGGRTYVRSAEAIQVDGRPTASPAEVAPGAHVRLGTAVSFVIAKG